jgi:hypothetical protein
VSKTSMRKTAARAGALTLLTTLLAAGAVVAQQPRGDQFTATIASLEGGGTAPVVIHIDHFSSDPQVQTLRGLLEAKGPDALRDALWDLEAGYIRVGGGLGYPVAVARSKPDANGGRVIRLMMDRPISFRESVNNTRSTDYPFSYIELHLDRSGKGQGSMIAAAKVTITAGTLDIESYGNQPLRLLQVRER